jgi:GNAT superfamily N-acetyltransferase
MTQMELEAFVESGISTFCEEQVKAGERPEDARRTAAQSMETHFPGGKPAPGQHVYRIVDGTEEPVGTLWIGQRNAARPEAFWVWDVFIEQPHRSKGYGRAVMVLAEDEARQLGAIEIGERVWPQHHCTTPVRVNRL